MEQDQKTKEYIYKAINIHGDKYDYSKSKYVKSSSFINIVCKVHGEFQLRAGDHLNRKYGCSKCGGVCKSNTREFIEKSRTIHGELYGYSKVEYENNRKKVIITCKKHGEFLIRPLKHIQGNGCKKCGIERSAAKRKSTTMEFIEKSVSIYGDTFDYSKVKYIDNRTKVIIICKKHGEFLSRPNCHLSGYLCPFCKKKTEAKLFENIVSKYSNLLTQFKQDWCKKKVKLPYDFCIPEYKIIIELDGPQHFRQVRNWSSPETQFENDKFKEECANQNGYSVIRLLQEDVYYDAYDWVKELCDAIEEIKSSNEITNVCLSKNDEYEKF
jgi:very-short-patch-repair endonuclease